MPESVLKPHIRALTPYVPPLEGRDPSKYILLDFNERTVPVPNHVTDALKSYIDIHGLQRYPNYSDMQAKIAKYAGVRTEECMFTNGSDQGIDLIVRCCCEKGSEAIIPAPTFAMYDQAADSEGLVIKRPSFDRVKGFPTEEVLAAINEKTSIVVISNPNNPTGTPVLRKDILAIAKKAPHAAIMVDECYYEFMGPEESVSGDIAEHPNLFVVRTFSKTWGIPSLRLGYVLTAEDNIKALCCVRGPYDINQLAGVALRAALENPKYIWDFVEEVNKQSKPKFEEYLTKRGIPFWPTSANFIFCDFENPVELEKGIREKGVLVRPKKDAAGKMHLRITIGTVEQMDKLMAILDELLPAAK